MGSEILRPEGQDATATSAPEVEFALVLSRMIDSVKSDPEHLRATVYELARHKLQEQLAAESHVDERQLSNALESAIRGVEAFARKEEPAFAALGGPESFRRPRPLAAPPHAEAAAAGPLPPGVEAAASIPLPLSGSLFRRGLLRFTTPWRFAAVFAIALLIVFAVKQRWVTIDTLRKESNIASASPPSAAPKPAQIALPQTAPPPAEPSPLTPTAYGIYAVSDDKLYELELLPGRAPDIRVAISPAILTPSRTSLPNGRLKFIVYRRDSATNAFDRAEVRIVARIAREMSFDAAGKPVVSQTADSWVIRNISIPFRTAPKKDNPDMYEVQGESAESELPPGRYALVLKGQAYDFTVAGPVTDPRQCLERLAATNGQFLSQCQKP